ncbi:MAG: DUF424 family protein [Candidatus Pacearchaeota archaeon]
MFVRVIKSYRDVVAICDSNLLGKIFEEGEFQLDVKENFYKGEEMTEEQVLDIITRMAREDAIFNIVGKQAIALAVLSGIITGEGIQTIQSIPFAMVLM